MRHVTRRFRMAAILGGCLLLQGVARAQGNGLQVGDMAPEFCCIDDKGNAWESRDHVGKKNVVLYFYPSDFAFCCTRQAKLYRDHKADFADLNAEVVGISGDDVQVHREFKETHQLTYTLLADSSGTVSRVFEVPLRNGGKAMGKTAAFTRTVTAARETFVIGLDGRIKYHVTDVSPIKDAQEVLDFLCK